MTDPELPQRRAAAAEEQLRATLAILRTSTTANDPIGALFDNTLARVRRGVEEALAGCTLVCQAGCAFCCYAQVHVTAVEAIAIATHLRQDDPEGIASIRETLVAQVAATSVMTPDEHSRANLRCAFLNDDNRCSIYPVRPVNCASLFSGSRQRCEEAFRYPNDSSKTIPIEVLTRSWAEGVAAGLTAGFSQLGLDPLSYELHSAVLRAIDVSDIGARWLRGEGVFQGCVTAGIAQERPAASSLHSTLGRNSVCPCGSGKKYKRCCMRKDR
jgi:Fe-S-cluster containining protein